ncbi:hypothetical protein CK203_088242 [Vitis vinifera]|uniref:Uncharacterized protein n=1 Tax=Vitis vinifera TaxID=29760 RepID=A0A438FJL8_VITVI|nr:hypothetical protein CK203_088242 [Vitis vinifera]
MVVPQPIADDLLYGAWNQCNSMVNSWILNSVAREIVDSLLYMFTIADIWNDMHKRFHQTNAPWVFHVIKALMALYQSVLDLNTYYTRHKILWDELKEFQPISVFIISTAATSFNSKSKQEIPLRSHCGPLTGEDDWDG